MAETINAQLRALVMSSGMLRRDISCRFIIIIIITALTRDGRTVAARGHVAYSAIVPDLETIRSLYIEPTSTSAECRSRTNVTTAAVNMIKQHGARERDTHREREKTTQSTCR